MFILPDLQRPHHDLNQLKRLAKELYQSFKKKDPNAVSLVTTHYRDADQGFQLSNAQLVIARAAGFASWPKLKAFIDEQQTAKARHLNAPFAARTFNSPRHLQVGWIEPDGGNDPTGNGEHTQGGTTSNGKVVDVPPSRVWFVEYDAGTDDGWDSFVDEVRQRQIPGINLRGNLKDDQVKDLADLHHLIMVCFSHNRSLTDDGIHHLSSLSNLEYLALVGCASITSKGLWILSHMPRLRVVRFYESTQISDQAIAELKDHQHLEVITLDQTICGDESLRLLADKTSITHISIGSKTTDKGLNHLSAFPGLTYMDEHRPQHKLDVYRGPNRSWIRLDSLHISNEGLAVLAKLHGVENVSISGHLKHEGLTDAIFAPMSQMENLIGFEMTGQVLTDQAMVAISRMQKLKEISLWDARATDLGMAELARSSSISRINAANFHNLSGKGVAALAGMPYLKKLSIGSKNCPDAALSALKDFPALESFTTGNQNIFTDEAFRYIAAIPGLKHLTNMYVRDEKGYHTTDRSTDYLAQARLLKSYAVWGSRITDKSCETLSKMSSLREILFYACPAITDDGIRLLGRLPALRKLDLQGMEQLTKDVALAFDRSVTVNLC